MILKKPLDWCYQTQPFGVNYVDFYAKLGMNGHNGLDFACNDGSNVYAAHEGLITTSKNSESAGNYIILTDTENKFETVYMHLKQRYFEVGQRIKQGVSMGLSDNTGIYTTGDHLHFGFRRLPFNQNNGYTGWEDPTPYLDKNFYNLPIDERYGRAKDWTSEFILRFKNPWVHKRLIRWYNRHPLSLTSREVNSIVYGGWGFDEAVNPILINNIYFLTKVEFREGKKPFCRMVVG